MAIHKITITTTVLVEADTLEEAKNRLAEMEMEAIVAEMDAGDMIGTNETTAAVTIPADKVVEELHAVGNSDGSFFGSLDDEA